MSDFVFLKKLVVSLKWKRASDQATIVGRVDKAIPRINICLMLSAIRYGNTYQLDSDLSVG